MVRQLIIKINDDNFTPLCNAAAWGHTSVVWKWSDDVSPLSGTEFCETEHLGMVISGNATVAFENEEPKDNWPWRYILCVKYPTR